VNPQGGSGGEILEARGPDGLRLVVSGISFTGRHGVRREERERGNRFAVDIELECRLLDSIETDELADTIDYQQITDLVREINDRRSFNLIESFAGAIADAILESHPGVLAVVARVSKLAPPGLGDVERTTAEVTRRRA